MNSQEQPCVFKKSEELSSSAFMILNKLIETKDSTPNYKFVSLNLLKTIDNYSDSSLEMLDSHVTLILNILKKEKDYSLKNLALSVLPNISSSKNNFKIIQNLKNILISKE